MATVYHRDQPGAPAVTFSSTNAVRFESFKTLLKACLVDGFGAYPAAGWELVSEAASHIVLRPATHSGYLCFGHTGSVIRVSVSATFTGVSGAIIQGDGAKSGINTASSQPQILYTYLLTNSSSGSWAIVADNRTFICSFSVVDGNAGSATPSDYSTASYSSTMFYAGEDSAGNFMVVGGGAASSTSVTAPDGFFSEPAVTSLKNPRTGLLVGAESLGAYFPLFSAVSSAQLASLSEAVVFPEVQLVKVPWIVSGHFCGFLRGIVSVPGLGNMFMKSVFEALGLSGVNSRNVTVPFSLDGVNNWIPAIKNVMRSPPMLMTDAPEYW